MRRRWILLAVLAAALALPANAAAHPLGNFSVSRYTLLALTPGDVRATFVLDMAEIPTFQALGDRPDRADARRWLAAEATSLAGRLHLTVNGASVALVPDPEAATVALRPGQAGLPVLRAELPLRAPLPGQGPYRLRFSDDTYGDRVGWKEVVVRARRGVVLSGSTAATRDVSHMLRRYPPGLLAAPLDVRTAEVSFRRGAGDSVDVGAPRGGEGAGATTWGSGFTSLVSHRDLTPGFVLLALAIAMFWGALHALTPGHGKSIVAAYLVGNRGTARHAVFLGVTVTITHTAGVFALGLATIYLSQYVVPETLYPWLSLVSGLIVLVLGVSMLSRRLAAAGAHAHHGDHHEHDGLHGHSHGPGGHSHLPPGADGSPITVRSLLALGVSGGILPCPSALVVMLGSIALGRTAFGLVLVLAFSIGLAGTLTAIGLLVVYARRFLERVPAPRRLVSAIPAFSALVIAVLGGVLTVRALDSFPGSRTSPLERVDDWIAAFAHGHGLALVAIVAVLLGLRHATDPDHLAAIATLAVGGEGRGRAGGARLGAAWGAGHATTLLAFGLPIVLFNEFLPDAAQRAAEALVGAMIIALALRLLWRAQAGAFHAHDHVHLVDGTAVTHTHGHSTRARHAHRLARTPWQAFSIGLVHGIGGSAGVGVLLLAAIGDRATAVLALVVFAALTAASMALLSTGLGVAIGDRWVRRGFERVAPGVGVVSLLFGSWYLLGALDLASYPL